MCGEHFSPPPMMPAIPGSSPHVRGALHLRVNLRHVAGIIPACAGSTKGSMTVKSTLRDHPRMCGEHFVIGYKGMLKLGSSPHVRGALGGS